MFDTFNTAWKPDFGSSVEREATLYEATFGDNYVQQAEAGINNNPEVWSLKWDVEESVANAIEAFIVSHAPVPFKFTNPRGVQIQVRAKGKCGHTWDSAGKHTVTSVFRQDFTPET